MNETAIKAVFLSYASQDAEAARRIAEALRAAGVEVWFDAEGGLEHGDEWDAKIRRQIKECVLFIPIISANTQAREEGYFRLEWDLAAERARTIASGVAFILPVVVDDTREPDALVPDRFRTVQWTRLRSGEVPPDVLQRFLKLWSHRTGVLKQQAVDTSAAPVASAPSAAEVIGKPGAKNYALIAAAVAVIVVGIGWWLLAGRGKPAASAPVPVTTSPAPKPATAPQSEARQLAEKARAMFDSLDGTRDDYKLAEELIAQAKAKDATDAEVCAAEAQLHERFIQRGWDNSDPRREAARAATQRAVRLDPQSFEARWAQAGLLNYTGSEGEERVRQLRELRRERPTDQRILRALATGLDRLEQLEEAVAIYDESAALPGGDPLALYAKSQAFWFAGRTPEAEAAIEASIKQKPFTGALLMNVWYKTILHGDLDGARAVLNRIAPAELVEDRASYFGFMIEWLARRPDAAIARLAAVPRDWLNDSWYRGPKGLLVGDAQQLAGRPDAAALEWRAALRLVEQRLAASPNDRQLINRRIKLLARLGQREEAERQFATLIQMAGIDLTGQQAVPTWVTDCCVLLGRKADAIRQISLGLNRGRHAVDFTAADLRLNPDWDPLRGEAEFAAVIAEADRVEKAAALTGGGPVSTAPAPAVGQKSVAVLAFANLSDDKANEYFSDGISEELLNVLAKVPGLTVRGRSSGFYFKGKQVKSAEIGQQLNVSYLVQGSVRRAGDRVRISAQLIRAATDEVVWSSGSLDRDLKDIFAVQDEIAGLIAKNLSLKIGVTARPPHQVNPEALTALLEGRSFWVLRTMEGFARAGELFNRAVALDPDWAPAHVALASLLAIEASYLKGGGESMNERFALAAREAKRAIELDPTLGEPHAALGKIAMEDRRFAEAEEEFRRALELEPNNALVVDWHGDLMVTRGRLDAAIAAYRRAMELEPLSPYILWDLAWELMHVRRYGEALPLIELAAALTPAGSPRLSLRRARLLLELDRKAEAEVALRVYLESPRTGSDPQIANEAVWCLRALSTPADREHWTAELLRQYPDSFASGVILLMLGREEEAYPLLEKFPTIFWQQLYWEPAFDPMRDTPRFQQLLEKLGCVAEYKVARETLARLLKEQEAKR